MIVESLLQPLIKVIVFLENLTHYETMSNKLEDRSKGYSARH